jgi:hypothetical protein
MEADMGRGISLNRYPEQILPIVNRGDGFRVKIVASQGVLIPDEIFLFQRDVLNPQTGAYSDHLVTVCSPEDLVTYPVNDPMINDLPPYFRMSVIDVLVGSREIAEAMWDAIDEQVDHLIAALNRKDRLVPGESTRAGDEIEDDNSQSESASASV